MKAPVLVIVVVLLHVMAIGTLVFVQGCGTVQPQAPAVEPPPAPVMPPPAAPIPAAMPSLKPAAPAAPVIPEKQAGDSLSRIASRHGLSQRELAELNGIKDPNKLRVGQQIVIPGYAGAVAPAQVKTARRPAPTPPAPKAVAKPAVAGPGEYIVESGDYLGKVAKKLGVKIKDLREANHLKSDMIRVGQKLKIPAGGAAGAVAPAPAPAPAPDVVTPPSSPDLAVPPPMPEMPAVTPPSAPAPAPAGGGASNPIRYPVSQGESVESIAKAFLVTPEAILKLNNLPAGAELKPGQTILIPIPD